MEKKDIDDNDKKKEKPWRLSTIHDDSFEDIGQQDKPNSDEEIFETDDIHGDEESKAETKKSGIFISKSQIKPAKDKIPSLNISISGHEGLRRSSLLDTLAEFELTKIERLESELKANENMRIKIEEENIGLCKRIKELEYELEKQKEYNATLIIKQKEISLEAERSKSLNNEGLDENSEEFKSLETKRELYDENMISLSFNQALIKYKSGQSLHSPYFDEWDEKIDIVQKVITRWTVHLDRIVQTGHDSSNSLNELRNIFMEDLTAFDFSTEIVNDLYCFADMLRELASMQDALYGSVKTSLLEYLKDFNKNFIMKVKENK